MRWRGGEGRAQVLRVKESQEIKKNSQIPPVSIVLLILSLWELSYAAAYPSVSNLQV